MTWTILEPDCGEDFDQTSLWNLVELSNYIIYREIRKDVVQVKERVWEELLMTEA